MKSVYFLVPNVKTSKAIITELAEAGISSDNVHLIGKDRRQLAEAHLNEATILQTTDVVHAAKQGAIAGGVLGLITGIAVATFPPGGIVLETGAVMGMGAFGVGFGTWVSAMIGVSIPNKVILQHKEEIDAGEIMIVVDLPKDREDNIKTLVTKHHPNASIATLAMKHQLKKAA